jgi:transcriptional regulator with XRE-family HTH domain
VDKYGIITMSNNNESTRLRELRTARGLTAHALGMAAGLNEMRVYAIERGRFRPTILEAARMGLVLGCDPLALNPRIPKSYGAHDVAMMGPH